MLRFVSGEPRRLGRRGTTAVEMAIVAQIFLLMLIGGMELGRYYFVAESVRYVVGEVARAAVVRPSTTWNDAAKSPFIAQAPILKPSAMSLNVVVQPATAPALTTVTVTANYTHALWMPFLGNLANSVNNSTTLRFAARPTS